MGLKSTGKMRKLFIGLARSQLSERFVGNSEEFYSATESVPCGTIAKAALLLDNTFGVPF